MKKKSYLTRAVLAMVASGMLYANVGFAATETKSASDITSVYTLNKGETLTLTGGVLAHNIVAGAQGKGDIILTAPLSVNTGVSITADIYGAKESGSTAIDGKSVSINGGTYIFADEFEGYDGIFGGKSTGSGDVTNNSIEFKSGTVNAPSSSDTHIENVLYGGLAEGNGNVTGNSVTVSGGTFTRTSVIGGKSLGTGDVTGNSVVITGGTFTGGKYNGIAGGTIDNKFDATTAKSIAVGSANSNTVKITGGVINGMNGEYINVAGGLIELSNFDEDDETQVAKLKQYYTFGDASHNTVEIVTNSNVALGKVGGGSTPSGNASYNIVRLSGTNITIEEDVIGGSDGVCFDGDVEGLNLNANSNEVYLTGITVKDSVKGGRARGTGTAMYNKVVIDGGNYGYDGGSTNIDGAISDNAEVSNNNVSVSNATVYCDEIIGGVATANGNSMNNSVIIKNSTISDDRPGQYGIAGGLSVAGTSLSNTVNISDNSNINVDVYGGVAHVNSVIDNTVAVTGSALTINNGKVVAGGAIVKTFDENATSPVVLGSANNNKVVMTDVQINGVSESYGSVYGGYMWLIGFDDRDETHVTALKTYYTSGGASNNTVEITTTKSVKLYEVLGGATFNGNANNNKITLNGSGIVVENDVNGGVLSHDIDGDIDILVNANGNVLTLTNITVNDSVHGGEGNGTGSTANDNEVHIYGGKYTNSHGTDNTAGITGGYAWAEANNNLVEIKNNAVITSDVLAGGVIASSTGSVKDNKVILDGAVFDFGGTNGTGSIGTLIVGGYVTSDDTFTGTRSGNSLELGSKGFTVNTGKAVIIQNFDSMIFADGATITNNGTLTFTNNCGNKGIGWNAQIIGGGTLNLNNGFVANDNVTQKIININNAAFTVAEGKRFNVETEFKMDGLLSKVTVDKDNVINDDFSLVSGMGEKINGINGELVLRMPGVNYTANQHKLVREALFGSEEKAKLTFKDANLILDTTTEKLTAGGTTTKTGNDLTIDGAEATVVNKADGSPIEGVGAQDNYTVEVVESGSTALVTIDKITFTGNSNLTAKDLQIKNVATAGNNLVIIVNGGILSLTGAQNRIVKDQNGDSVATEVQVEAGSMFNLGQENAKTSNNITGLNKLVVGGNVNIYHMNMAINVLVVNGGTLWIDPSYQEVATLNFGSGGIGIATDGTVWNVGMDYGKLSSALASAGIGCNSDKTVDGTHGVVAFGNTDTTTLDLSGKHLIIDEAYGTSTAELKIGSGGVLAVASKSAGKSGVAAIQVSNANSVSIDEGADLIVVADDFEAGVSEYNILKATSGEFDELWLADNIYASDPAYRLMFKGKGSMYTLTTDWNTVDHIFGEGAIAAPNVYNRILQKAQGTEANTFLRKVIKDTAGAGSTLATKARGATALNAVTSMGELAAVQHGAVSMVNQINDTLSENLGLATRPITDEKYEKKIWASYVNNKETVEDLALAKVNADYTAKYRGASVGADLWSSEKAVGGLAITYSKGGVNGHNGGATTNNDAKYYGVSVYNRINVGNDSALLYDFDYLNTKNEISQYNFGTNITADAKVDVLSAGVRYEKGITTGKSVLAPFVGLRYLHLNNKEYTNSLNMHFSADKQNVFQSSVGLNWHGEFQAPNSVWTYRPYIETGYVWNMGNRDCNQVVSFDGAPNTLAYDVVDSGSYFAKLGMNFERKHFGFGFGYKYQKGSTAKISRWNVDMNWKF